MNTKRLTFYLNIICIFLSLLSPRIGYAISLAFSPHSALIQELHTMKEVLVPVLQDTSIKDTLVTLDSDNTILKAAQTLGNESWGLQYFGKIAVDPGGAILHQPWAQDLFKKYFRNGNPRPLTPEEAFWVGTDIFEAVHSTPGTSKLVEPATAVLLRSLQQAGSTSRNIRLMVLTAARGSFLEKRVDELKRLGIDFQYRNGASIPSKDTFTFAPGALGKLSSPRYLDGVFHTSYQDKGLMMIWFFLKTGFPQKVIFIDDNLTLNQQVDSALSDVVKAIERLKTDPVLGNAFIADQKGVDLTQVPGAIPHLCFRYTAADAAQYLVFDPIVSLELSTFLKTSLQDPMGVGSVISDETASQLILKQMSAATP